VFGPVLSIWFAAMAVLGLRSIAETPAILQALAPHHAVSFLASSGSKGFILMGTVFLAVTGAEVLYADMGHFGPRPIRISWLFVVMPALVINYMGQGAHLLRDGSTADNLFYQICPPALLYPCVALATAATVIASQAVISGTFSLARQATQLGIWPRMRIVHTSVSRIGQVYVPAVNTALFAGTIALILGFRESGKLASAYGIAVSATMLITTIMMLLLYHSGRKTGPVFILLIGALLIPVDMTFFLANALKISSGGWVVLLVSASICAASLIWHMCRGILGRSAEVAAVDPAIFVADVRERKPLRVAGTAVFFTPNPNGLPRALLHNFKHNKVLHDATVLLTVQNMDVPALTESERITTAELGEGFYRIIVRYGFSETPDVPAALGRMNLPGISFAPGNTTFFLGKESLFLRKSGAFSTAVKRIFMFMSRNSLDVSSFYGLPPTRVVELGAQEQL
jgi:KUP system potassium uptake protein